MFLNLRQRSGDRQHAPAVPFPFGHQLAPTPGDPTEGLDRERARGTQRAEFPVAVPDRGIEHDVEAAQDLQRAHAHRPEGWLRVLGRGDCRPLGRARLVGPGVRWIQRARHLWKVSQHMLDGLPHAWEETGQVAEHVHRLRTLAGEQRRQQTSRFTLAECGALGRGEPTPTVGSDRGRDLTQHGPDVVSSP